MSQSREAATDRRNRVVAALREHDRDLLIAGSPASIAYLTDRNIRGLNVPGTVVVVTRSGELVLVTSAANRRTIEPLEVQDNVRYWQAGEGSTGSRTAVIKEVCHAAAGPSPHCAVEAGALTPDAVGLGDAEGSEAKRILSAAMAVKDRDEIRRLRQAADLADIGYTAVVDRMHPELRVYEIVRNVDRSLRAAGGGDWWSPFENEAGITSVTHYPSASIICLLGRPIETGTLEKSQPVPFALHPVSECYTGAVGTTIMLSPPSDEVRSRATLLSDATAAAIDALRPGVTTRKVYDAFRSAISGQFDAPDPSIGFSAGTGASAPVLGPGTAEEVLPGMAFCVRTTAPIGDGPPIAYQTIVLVTETGPERLDTVPLRLIELY